MENRKKVMYFIRHSGEVGSGYLTEYKFKEGEYELVGIENQFKHDLIYVPSIDIHENFDDLVTQLKNWFRF
jgi:hypothetical protein